MNLSRFLGFGTFFELQHMTKPYPEKSGYKKQRFKLHTSAYLFKFYDTKILTSAQTGNDSVKLGVMCNFE
jgi:hypothetical protein